MKKRFIFLLLCFTLVACSNKEEDYFTGTIEDINGDSATVKIEEGEILKSGSVGFVNLSVNEDTTFQIGDKVKVKYGSVGESLPLSIDTKSVEIID